MEALAGCRVTAMAVKAVPAVPRPRPARMWAAAAVTAVPEARHSAVAAAPVAAVGERPQPAIKRAPRAALGALEAPASPRAALAVPAVP